MRFWPASAAVLLALALGVPAGADKTVFLLAPASDYMHGAVIPVDGGWLAR